jgi:exonuclease SbcD
MARADSLRLIHTADWHLGRLFHGVHLTEDQSFVLDQLVALIKDTKPDAVLIAGDIYDRAVPPPEAVNLLDDVLSQIVLGARVPVVIIAGNHDSPSRLGFASRLLSQQRLHVFGALPGTESPVILQGRGAAMPVLALPYAEPAVVRDSLGRDDIRSHDDAMQALLERARLTPSPGKPSVALAHCFVVGAEECESERPLTVGGAASVESTRFAGFSYVALGHLHRAQVAGGCHYAGSLLKYSFSEATHTKSVNLVEIDAGGRCRVERVPLAPRRDCRVIEGRLADLLEGPRPGENRDDYLQVRLLDTEALFDPMGRLREVYPNVLDLARTSPLSGGATPGAPRDHRQLSDLQLFASFFSEMTAEDLSPVQAEAYVSVVEAHRRGEREAGS